MPESCGDTGRHEPSPLLFLASRGSARVHATQVPSWSPTLTGRYLERAPQEGKAGSISFPRDPKLGGQWEALPPRTGRRRDTPVTVRESSPPPCPPPPPGKPRKPERPGEPGSQLQGRESAGSCPDLTPKHTIEGGPFRCHWGDAVLGMGGPWGSLWSRASARGLPSLHSAPPARLLWARRPPSAQGPHSALCTPGALPHQGR